MGTMSRLIWLPHLSRKSASRPRSIAVSCAGTCLFWVIRDRAIQRRRGPMSALSCRLNRSTQHLRNAYQTLAKSLFQNPRLPAMPKFRFLGRSEPSATFFAHQHTLSISSVQDRCCVDRLRPPPEADKDSVRPGIICALMTRSGHCEEWN
jgi:hypothetical protein